MQTAVSDTGPLVVLAKLNRLDLLPLLFRHVLIPSAVYQEAVVVGRRRGYPDAHTLAAFLQHVGWSIVVPPEIPAVLRARRLGQGEQEAIALALQYEALLLIDDRDARWTAQELGVLTRGSLGVLVMAYRAGLLSAVELDYLLDTIEQREDIWIDPALCRKVRTELLPNGN